MKAQEFITQQLEENLHKWFKEKWVRFGPDGKIRGDCARGSDSEGKPKCLPQSKAQALGKKGRASAAARKRRQDPNPERKGAAINVATRKKSNEGIAEADNQSSAKTGIYQTDVFGAKAYHAKCMEPNCDWESKRFDRIKQAQAAAEKHAKSHFKQAVAEGSEQKMSVQDTLAYLKKVMGTESHQDWRNWIINNNEYFVLKNIPVNSLKSDLSGLDKANVEKYKQMDFSKAPPIVVDSSGNIIDGYHRVNVAKALKVPALKAWVGVKKQGVAESFLAEETLDQYLASLKNSGAKIIGRGNNATVFTNPEDDGTVIKVMHQPDPAYLAYLRQSNKHPNNPWLPRVLDVNSQAFDTANSRSSTTAWIIVLEKLQPASAAEVKNAVDTVLATVDPRYLGRQPVDAYRTFDDIKKLWPIIAQHSSDADIRVVAEFLSQFPPQDIDVSRSNVMMRGSQLVFADPVLS